jgi:hypothetical protein
VQPMLDSMGAKMLMLEEVIGGQLEADGHDLVKKVVEHALTCFWSRDPNFSLEPVVHGTTVDTQEAARDSVQGVTKIVVARFQWQPEDE